MTLTAINKLKFLSQLDSNRITRIRSTVASALPVSEICDHVRAALAKPIDYPPLASATVLGDNVVVAISDRIPCSGHVLAGALAALQDAGVDAMRLTLLVSQSLVQDDASGTTFRELADQNGIALAIHNPDHEADCSLLGVTKAGRPLRLNRLLCDADLVLPIGVSTADSDSATPNSSCDSLFPMYSDRETINRYYAPIAADSKVIRSERKTEIDEAGWLLGIGLTVPVIPSPAGGADCVLAGEPTAVAVSAAQRYREIWSCKPYGRADLVVATVGADGSRQDWQSVGRALEVVEHFLEPGGLIVLWTEIAESPGPSLHRLSGNDDYLQVERELMRDRFAESCTAVRLGRALQRGTIYLRSHLSAETIEGLGLAPIDAEDELLHLIDTHEKCVLLEQADRLLVSAE